MNGDEDEIDRIAASFPLETRLHVEEGLLGAWADAVRTGHGREASRALEVARRIGTALAALHGEHMPADAIVAIEDSEEDPERRSVLVEAHRLYRDARALHGAFKFDKARPLFERAGRGFARGRSPAESLAALYLAVGYLQQQELPTALKILRRIVLDERSRRSPGLLTRTYRTMGITLLVSGEPAMSLNSYRAALSAARKAGAVEDEAAAHAVFAENYRYLGRPRETWKHLHEALALAPKLRSVSRLNGIALEIAEACTAAGEVGAAIYFRDESVRVMRDAGGPVLLSHALLLRARTLRRLKDREGARRDLDETASLLEQIPDEKQRQRNAADFFIAQSEIDASRSPADAIRALTRALDFYAGRENHLFLNQLYLARARAELAIGEEALAEEDLRKGIEEYEIQRQRVSEEPFQISFFDQSDSLFDEMVRLQAGRLGGEEAAFDFAERDRARSLLDRLGPLDQRQRSAILRHSSEPLSAREIHRSLPAGVALIEYALLKDRLLVWVVRREDFSMTQVPVQASSLELLVKRLPVELARSSFAASARLYDLLIRPVLPWIAQGDQIILVPDGVLHAVPFAALLDVPAGRYLVQDHVLSVAPSATFYVEAREGDCSFLSRQAPTVLAVGNPSFSRDLAKDLPSLPESETEATRLANLFPGSEILTGDRATPEAFLVLARQHEMVHFGGHAIVNRDFPLLSHLLLAPEDQDDSGLLYAHELYKTRLENIQLVVLAACHTASGPIQGEGVQSLARAFLAAGVPNVVASLWNVEDSVSSRLVQVFYEHLRQGDSAPVALRRAQLTLLRNPDPSARSTADWAAFEFVGASCAMTNNGKE
jgi:CHAT domain-containing protein